jgi:hypothetical protein
VSKELSLLNKYLENGARYHNELDKEFLEELSVSYHEIIEFERPDLLIHLNEKLLAIEHFEFDASSKNRKGSNDKREFSERNREFDRLISETTEFPLIQNQAVNCEYSYSNYIKNFKETFSKHLSNITDYKNNIIESGLANKEEEILICFFIEDTTPLGTYRLIDGDLISCNLFFLREYVEIISNSREIDFVLFGHYDNQIEFMSNTEKTLKVLNENRIDDLQEYFFCFEPQESRFCIHI